MPKRRARPTSIFVEVNVRSATGTVKALKPYVEAATHAIMQLAIDEHVFCGVVRHRNVVSARTLERHMTRHGFYGKVKA